MARTKACLGWALQIGSFGEKYKKTSWNMNKNKSETF